MKTLIVEDDFLARALLSTLLSEYGPCHLVVDGQEAVNAISRAYDEKEPYDLVCLDIMMPVMDGQKALELIRADESERSISKDDGISVFMVTALDDEENRKKATETGCDAYLTKPLNKQMVIDKLEELKLI